MPNIVRIVEEAAVVAKETEVGKEAITAGARLATEALDSFQDSKLAKKYAEKTEALSQLSNTIKDWLGTNASIEMVTQSETGATRSPLTPLNTDVQLGLDNITLKAPEGSVLRVAATPELRGLATKITQHYGELTLENPEGVFGSEGSEIVNIRKSGKLTRIIADTSGDFPRSLTGDWDDNAIEHYVGKPGKDGAEPWIKSGKKYRPSSPGKFDLDEDSDLWSDEFNNVKEHVRWSNGHSHVYTFRDRSPLTEPEEWRLGSDNLPYRFDDWDRLI